MYPLRHSLRCCMISIALLTFSLGSSGAPPVVESQPKPDRDYRLFVGLNVEVSQDDHYALIEGYNNNRVQTDLSPDLISLRNVDDVRFTYRAKLSRQPLTIIDLHAEQIVSTAKAARDAMRNQQALQAFQSMRMNAMQAAMGEANTVSATDNGDETPASEDAFSDLNRAFNDFSEVTSKMTDPSVMADEIAQRKEDGEPTALLITGKLSSPIRITDAYIVGVARISTEESVGSDVLFFDRVPIIDQKPRKIEIVKEGLPGEFKVLEVKIHIYRNGQELVNDQSAKQFALTKQEVMEYLALQRSGEHRGESLPPEPAWALAPPELFANDQPDNFDYPLTLQVDALGQVTAIDENTIAPRKVKAVAQELFFLPALENGTPVAGIAQVNLKDFYR